MHFFEQLEHRAQELNSLLCIGLDPHIPDLNAPTPEAARDFCYRLIDAAAPVAAAFKPNAAFFEVFGSQGWQILEQVIARIPDGIPVILDAKRGDISSTAHAYAQAVFGALGAGAVTLSPYLGRDSIEPFLEDPLRGVFLLCKTSNPGAADLQDLLLAADRGGGGMVYEAVARLAQEWSGPGSIGHERIGLVVGATYPMALERVRRAVPQMWILAPGVGAQGGDLEAALDAGLRGDGSGLLLPVSRGISRADDPHRAALELRDAINRGREARKTSLAQPRAISGHLVELAEGLLEAGCVRFGRFTLKSGLISPIYIDLRRLVGFPMLLDRVAAAYVTLLRSLSFDRLAALPYAALPIGAAVGLKGGWPLVYPRKEAKDYGTKAEVEGVYFPGETVVVLDDLATTGGSKFEAIERLTAAGLQARDVVVLIDRQSGAGAALAGQGFRMHSVFRLTDLLDHWEQTGRVDAGDLAAARAFIRATAGDHLSSSGGSG